MFNVLQHLHPNFMVKLERTFGCNFPCKASFPVAKTKEKLKKRRSGNFSFLYHFFINLFLLCDAHIKPNLVELLLVHSICKQLVEYSDSLPNCYCSGGWHLKLLFYSLCCNPVENWLGGLFLV